MKLNFDAIRETLIFIERETLYEDKYDDVPNQHKTLVLGQIISSVSLNKFSKEDIAYSVEQLVKENYLTFSKNPIYSNGNLEFVQINGLSWKGHELLDGIKNDTVWGHVKEKAKQLGGISFSHIANAAAEYAKMLLSNPDTFKEYLDKFNNLFT